MCSSDLGAEEASSKVMSEIEALLAHPQVKAVGECGLDYNRNFASHTAQKKCFSSHLELAKKYENVYIEPGALGSRKASEILPIYLKRMKEEGIIDRVIYGSDGPQFPGYTASHLNNMIDAMEEVGYTGLEMKAVLESNFERVFDL